MNQTETVRRDMRSYRQGLVLGLTMAEVFLLLVFALLIALAALWNGEHQKRIAAEVAASQTPDISEAVRDLVPDLIGAVAAAGRDKTARVLAELKAGRELQVLSADEQKFVEEVRQEQKGASHQAISDQWRRLTQARLALPSLSSDDVAVAQELQKAYPDIKDPKRLVSLVGQGLAAEKKGEHDWPPIINLSEAQGYFFATGKAEIDPDFENHLRTVIVPQLVQLT
ncbi:MAG: hypothetical protein J0H89_01970, partial [Rhizobiales bacterium]|nr:hypothetical protein [Hyphomicrobiales bacterium]